MPPDMRNPAPVGRHGAREADHLAGPIASEITFSPLHLQVARILARLACSEARAKVVAELAFDSRAAR